MEASVLLETSRLKSEADWRSKLEVGDKVDVIRRVKSKKPYGEKCVLKSWGRGTVVWRGHVLVDDDIFKDFFMQPITDFSQIQKGMELQEQ